MALAQGLVERAFVREEQPIPLSAEVDVEVGLCLLKPLVPDKPAGQPIEPVGRLEEIMQTGKGRVEFQPFVDIDLGYFHHAIRVPSANGFRVAKILKKFCHLRSKRLLAFVIRKLRARIAVAVC